MSTDRPSFELQAHSLHSDGALSPREVVAAAARAGVRLLALTDHDSIDGTAAATEVAHDMGLRSVSGVEISVLDPAGSDLHLLGYGFDPADAALERMLRRSRGDRERRAERTIARLAELGFALELSEVRSRQAAGQSVGRPHLAAAVLDHPANRDRLAAEGITDPTGFLVTYLIEGAPAFVPRTAPSVTETIAVIHAAGGLAVWAHPFFDLSSPGHVLETLERFTVAGLDGVEAFYPTHTREQTVLLAAACAERGLLTTGSSDFHGPGHRTFNRFGAFSTFDLTPNLGPLADGQP
jgi:predicted metal-dependent phosphoesterase TrpH